MSKKVGIFVGSNRKDSFSKKLAEFVKTLAPAGFDFEIIGISDLPLYNQDYDEKSPESYVEFREKVKTLDAFLFVTPEHNRSVPAVLKNALDIASRPWGQSVWGGKPGAIISTSVGAIGGFGANHHLRQVLSFLNIQTLQQPEAYVGNITAFLDEKGSVSSPDSVNFLKSFVDAFVNHINIFTK